DCLVCVKVNNFSGSLGKLDMYLAGVSPMPLAMLVNMQLAGAVGDPMMTGLDMTGDVVFFALPSAKGSTEPPAMGLMVPVTNYEEFIKNNPNCTKGADNVTTLAPPQSPMGSFVMMAAPGNKHALVLPENMKPSLTKALQAITTKSGKQLSSRLNASQTKDAAEAPMFVYVNVASLYDRFSQDLLDTLNEVQKMAPEGAAGTQAFGMEMITGMVEGFGKDVDSLTLTLNPEATILKINSSVRAKDGTDLAKMLAADPQAPKSFKLGGYLDDASAVNGLIKMNRPFFTKINDKFLDIMNASTDDAEMKKQTAEMKTIMKTLMDSMGNEISFSFSYAAGMPPIVLREVIDVKSDNFFDAAVTKGLAYTNAMYKAMDVPMTMAYQENVSSHKGIQINSMTLKMDMPADVTPEMQAQMAQMGAMMNFNYHIAQSGKKAYVTMGQGSEETIKTMIDQSDSGTIPAEFQAALDTFEKTPYSDYVCSVNVIRLMTGLGEMMGSMGNQPGMPPIPNIFGQLNVESNSSMALGGQIADGQAMAAQMQMQQQMQQQPQAESAPTQSNDSPTTGTAPEPDLQKWIGKDAPELKMVDLQGKIHRVSRLKGKKVVLDFWATWCPPCKESIPHLIELRKNNQESDLVIIGLSDEPIDRLNKFIKEYKINYPIVSYSDEPAAPYGDITGLPTMFLIDSKGVIQDVLVGLYPAEEVNAKIKQLK
ncbi:MAG: TlpA family protein disulfide reductase, partial [Planctomycetota bacterium]